MNPSRNKAFPSLYPQGGVNGTPRYRQFPTFMTLYKSGAISPTYALAVHENQPLYSASLHTGWSGKPDVVLHAGPNDSYPPLATTDREGLHKSSTITVPTPAGVLGQASEEHLSYKGGFQPTHSFIVALETTGQRETFEWRKSHDSDIDSLGGRSHGWKLVRLASGEGVAAWTAVNSFSKKMSFEFLGSDASGSLGERWAVMAVITALKLWDLDVKSHRGVAAAAAAV